MSMVGTSALGDPKTLQAKASVKHQMMREVFATAVFDHIKP